MLHHQYSTYSTWEWQGNISFVQLCIAAQHPLCSRYLLFSSFLNCYTRCNNTGLQRAILRQLPILLASKILSAVLYFKFWGAAHQRYYLFTLRPLNSNQIANRFAAIDIVQYLNSPRLWNIFHFFVFVYTTHFLLFLIYFWKNWLRWKQQLPNFLCNVKKSCTVSHWSSLSTKCSSYHSKITFKNRKKRNVLFFVWDCNCE